MNFFYICNSNSKKNELKKSIMKKLMLTLGIFASGIMLVQAQDATKMQEKVMNNLNTNCKLTPDETTKVKPFVTTLVNDRIADKKANADNKAGFMTAMKASQKKFDANLKTVLTADQMKAWSAFEAKEEADKAAKTDKTQSTTKPQ
jgi:hypothetical protein